MKTILEMWNELDFQQAMFQSIALDYHRNQGKRAQKETKRSLELLQQKYENNLKFLITIQTIMENENEVINSHRHSR